MSRVKKVLLASAFFLSFIATFLLYFLFLSSWCFREENPWNGIEMENHEWWKNFCLFAPKPPPPLVKNQHQQWDNGDNKNKNNFATRKWNKIKSQSGHRKVILTDYRAMIIILMLTKNDDFILLGDFCNFWF